MNQVLAALVAAATPDLARWLRANEAQVLRVIARSAEHRQRLPRNAGKPRAWTKSEQKKVWDAVDGWRMTYRPGLSRSKLCEKAIASDLTTIALSHLSGLRALYAQRVLDYRKTAQNYASNADSYAREMVARFTDYAAEEEKHVAVFDKLIARIEAEGMPPKPDGWED